MEKRRFSKLGVFTILLFLVTLLVVFAVAEDYERAAQITNCFNATGKVCSEQILPGGETLQDCYNRTGRICRPDR